MNGQSTLSLTDNLGWTVGSHHLTFGTRNELIHLYDDDFALRSATGHWFFTGLDALEAGTPDAYLIRLPAPFFPRRAEPTSGQCRQGCTPRTSGRRQHG